MPRKALKGNSFYLSFGRYKVIFDKESNICPFVGCFYLCNAFRYWADFCYASLQTFHICIVKIVPVCLFLVYLWALDLKNIHYNNRCSDVFTQRFQILSWFMVCESSDITYRWRLKLVLVIWFLAKLWALDWSKFLQKEVKALKGEMLYLSFCRYRYDLPWK